VVVVGGDGVTVKVEVVLKNLEELTLGGRRCENPILGLGINLRQDGKETVISVWSWMRYG